METAINLVLVTTMILMLVFLITALGLVLVIVYRLLKDWQD